MGCAQSGVAVAASGLQSAAGTWESLYTLGEEIGRGSYGRVFLVRANADSSAQCAAKFVRIRKCDGLHDPLDDLELRLLDLKKTLQEPRVQRNASRRREIREQLNSLELDIQRLTRQMSLRSIQREIKIMRLCAHPRVLSLVNVFTGPEEVVIVMPLCQMTLQSAYPRLGWDCEKTVAVFFADMCEGVEFIHRCGVVHRDLKPDNMMVMRDGRLCIADFGLATYMDKTTDGVVGGAGGGGGGARCTRAGTAGFLPPEKTQGPAGDMWALGCTLYWMIFGKVWNLSSLSRQVVLAAQREKLVARGAAPMSDASISTCASDEDPTAESRLQNCVKRVLQLSKHPLYERSESCRLLLLQLFEVNTSSRLSARLARRHQWVFEDHPVRQVRRGGRLEKTQTPACVQTAAA